MREEFEPAAHGSSDSQFVSESELRMLLLELHEEGCTLRERDDEATVEAVAEATGHSADHVANVLQTIRTEDYEARLSRRLRELEEPLHRVERPGHAPPDPMASYFKLNPGESLSPLLDRLKKTGRQPVKKSVKTPPTQSDLLSRVMANFVMLLFLAIIVSVVVFGVVQQIR